MCKKSELSHVSAMVSIPSPCSNRYRETGWAAFCTEAQLRDFRVSFTNTGLPNAPYSETYSSCLMHQGHSPQVRG